MPESEYLELKKELAELKQILKELHAVTTGKLYTSKTRLSRKEKDEMTLIELRRNAHRRMLNR